MHVSGAIPKLLEIFPSFLKDDMKVAVLKRFVVHSARTSNDLETFQAVVETGLQQNPELDRGIITGDVLQTLVIRKYIRGLEYLKNHDPPLIRPSDVLELDLFACLVKSSHQFTYSADVFRLLLELEPRAVAKRTDDDNYLPIHIFCEFIMDKIESDEQFYGILEMLLTFGTRYGVGDIDGISGFAGIFEEYKGTIPAKHLYRYVGRMREVDENDSSFILEAACRCDTEVEWIQNVWIPSILDDEGSARIRNRAGRLPLHYCITSRSMTLRCIQCLVRSDKSTIDEIDPVTGLLPSLLAASAPAEYYYFEKSSQLNVTYELYRKHPITPSDFIFS